MVFPEPFSPTQGQFLAGLKTQVHISDYRLIRAWVNEGYILKYQSRSRSS